MKITFLGTGGAVPTASRDNTSFLVNSAGQLFLVDCPGSVNQKILKSGYQPEQVSAIFITHVHPDHVYGLPAFVHSQMLEEQAVKLYGSEETVEFGLHLLDLFSLRKNEILYRVEPQPLVPGLKTEISPGFEVTGIPVPHHSSSLAFLLETAEGKVLYSGDAPISPPVFERASELSCLIHDCSTPCRFLEPCPFLREMHSNSLDLGQAAEKAGVRLLVPCHFFSDLGFSLAEIEAEIRKNYQGHLFLPDDFSELEVDSG